MILGFVDRRRDVVRDVVLRVVRFAGVVRVRCELLVVRCAVVRLVISSCPGRGEHGPAACQARSL